MKRIRFLFSLIAVSFFAGLSFCGDTNRLKLINTANYGEGGGSGAGNLPLSEDINSEVCDNAFNDYVVAQAVELTGTVKVKGFASKTFVLENVADSEENSLKSVCLYVEKSQQSGLQKLKNKKIKVKGVFYENTFLVFEYSE